MDASRPQPGGRRRVACGRCRRGPGVRRRRRPAPCGGRRIGQPAHQDRPRSQQAFAIKMSATFSRAAVSWSWDTVTTSTRRPGCRYSFPSGSRCRRGRNAKFSLSAFHLGRPSNKDEEMYNGNTALAGALALGQPLPTLHMDKLRRFRTSRLEASYRATCTDLHPPSGVIRLRMVSGGVSGSGFGSCPGTLRGRLHLHRRYNGYSASPARLSVEQGADAQHGV